MYQSIALLALLSMYQQMRALVMLRGLVTLIPHRHAGPFKLISKSIIHRRINQTDYLGAPVPISSITDNSLPELSPTGRRKQAVQLQVASRTSC